MQEFQINSSYKLVHGDPIWPSVFFIFNFAISDSCGHFYWVAVGEPSHKMRTGLSPTWKNDWNA